MDEGIRAHRQPIGYFLPVRMDVQPNAGAGAASVWRRPYTGEHHAPGRQSEGFSQSRTATGEPDQHQSHRLPGGQVYEAGAFQREELGKRWTLTLAVDASRNELSALHPSYDLA